MPVVSYLIAHTVGVVGNRWYDNNTDHAVSTVFVKILYGFLNSVLLVYCCSFTPVYLCITLFVLSM